MSCLCATFITAYFVSFSSLCLCLLLFPPSLCPHPLCPFLLLPFQFISSLITPPSPPLLCPVRPSSGLRSPQPLRLLVLFPGLKPSQTISADVFRAKGQRIWGEVCLGCVMWWNSGALQMPFLPNANMLIQFLLSLFLSAFCLQVYIIITTALSGSQRRNEVFSWSEVFSLLSFWAWGTSECPTKCIFVSDNANLTHKQSAFTNCCSLIISQEKKQQYSKALCPAFSTFSHLNLWMLGLTRLPLSSSRPNTKMSGSGM